jgi:hypothetical protein
VADRSTDIACVKDEGTTVGRFGRRLIPLMPVTTSVSVHVPLDGDCTEGAVGCGVDPDGWLQPSNGTIIRRINISFNVITPGRCAPHYANDLIFVS